MGCGYSDEKFTTVLVCIHMASFPNVLQDSDTLSITELTLQHSKV
jgi:hypothetical protein